MKLIGRVDTSEGHFSREKNDLVESLYRRGLLNDGSSLDDILLLTVEHVLSRRLQSQVYYCGLASSMRQARQLVIHGHIGLGEQKMTVPSYIITRDDENTLTYHHTSDLHDNAKCNCNNCGTGKYECKKDRIGPVRKNGHTQAFELVTGEDGKKKKKWNWHGHPIRCEIEFTRDSAEYEEGGDETPSEEFVAGVAEAAEAAPAAEDTEVEGGDE